MIKAKKINWEGPSDIKEKENPPEILDPVHTEG